MKLKLLPKNCYFLVVAFCILVSQSAFSQKLQTSASPKIPKGHQLYKQSKIYDNTQKQSSDAKPTPVGDRAQDRFEYEFEMLKNPKTGKIPNNIKLLEADFSKSIQENQSLKKGAQQKGFSYWKNRGPYNIGGRTRALAIDRYNENVIFAGGVSGGLWRSNNAGKTWRKITRNREVPSITAIVQDPRPRKGHIWYYTSGERFGNSASGRGAFYTGAGVYKSTNYGYTWKLLKSTADNDLTSISPFEISNSIAINPANGDVYVATFNGVHRSKDGGRTFEEVLAGDFDNYTEVMITPSGQIYATVEFFGNPNKGYFTSRDGDNWTNITPELEGGLFHGRTVMAYNPSDESEVYFFAQNLLTSSAPYLLKYDAKVDSLQNRWTDLSANLPTRIGGYVGNLNLQGGYNMVIKIKPDDPNFIILGGTNLYRSTTGFTTPASQESWIGGYSPLNNVSVYTNQHPDQHNFIFYPSNPNKVLSGNDGGVMLAENILDTIDGPEPVEWTSLNNGYLTTQPYTVAFDPQANSDDLVAGFQDNGTWYTNSTNSKAVWEEDFGGDGAFAAIADGGATRYVSSQRGNVYRFNFDENGSYQSFTKIRPAIAKNPGFINPFVLDPINDNIMYYLDGSRILRNNNLDEVPVFSNADATTNWVVMNNTTVPEGNSISALGLSRYPVANRLYYGTNTGLVYRMDNANVDAQQAELIVNGLPEDGGYVSSLTVDPSNSDVVILTYSNYGVQSVFYTTNGGNTWQNISGNLEENADGSGNGPSVRSAAFLGNGQGIFVGTSTGLYYAFYLNGNNTRWRREPFRIGNAIVPQVKTRKDGFVAIATHGNGLYSAKFPILPWNKIPNGKLEVAYLLPDLEIDMNSAPTTINVKDLFTHSRGAAIKVEMTNSNSELVTATLDGDELTLSYAPESEGVATISLVATSGNEQVAEGFTVTVAKPPVYEQNEAAVASAPSQYFPDFQALVQSADDFVVPAGKSWLIDRVYVSGGENNSPSLESAYVVVYSNSENGTPGEIVYFSEAITPISDPSDANLDIQLPEALKLEEGAYWVSVFVDLAFGDEQQQWFWSTQAKVNGSESNFQDAGDLFGAGATSWTPASQVFDREPADQIFKLFGDAMDAEQDPTTSESVELVEIETNPIAVAWPNPSVDKFKFDLKAFGKGNISIQVFSLSGKLVYDRVSSKRTENLEWDATNMEPGVYLINVKGDNLNYKGKLVKN